MDVTSLPTESLHKFLALAGLLILTIGPAYLHRLYYQIAQKVIDAETEDEILNRQMDHMDKLVDLLANEHGLDKTLVEQKLKSNPELIDRDLDDTAIIYKSGVNSLRDLRERFLTVKIASAKFKGNVKTIRLLHDQMQEVIRWGYILFTIGLLMTCIGFYRWYSIQGYIDRGIINEAMKK